MASSPTFQQIAHRIEVAALRVGSLKARIVRFEHDLQVEEARWYESLPSESELGPNADARKRRMATLRVADEVLLSIDQSIADLKAQLHVAEQELVAAQAQATAARYAERMAMRETLERVGLRSEYPTRDGDPYNADTAHDDAFWQRSYRADFDAEAQVDDMFGVDPPERREEARRHRGDPPPAPPHTW